MRRGVRWRPAFRAVDNDRIDGSLRGFESQAKLFLKRGED